MRRIGRVIASIAGMGLLVASLGTPVALAGSDPDVVVGHLTWANGKIVREGRPTKTLGVLPVPQGIWVAYARVAINGGQSPMTCSLGSVGGSSSDHESGVVYGRFLDGPDRESLDLQTSHRFPGGPGKFQLRCKAERTSHAGTIGSSIHDIQMVALRVGSLTTRHGNGTATTVGAGSPAARQRDLDIQQDLPGAGESPQTVGDLSLAAGSWWVRATIQLRSTLPCSAHCKHVLATCSLADGSATASGSTGLIEWPDGPVPVPNATGTITIDLPVTSAAASSVALRCGSDKHEGDAILRNARLLAIQAGELLVGSPPVDSGSGSPLVTSVSHPSTEHLADGWHTVATLPLPTESDWLVTARLTVYNDPDLIYLASLPCRLYVGTHSNGLNTDDALGRRSGTFWVGHAIEATPAPSARLRCQGISPDDAQEPVVSGATITAIRAGSMTKVSIRP